MILQVRERAGRSSRDRGSSIFGQLSKIGQVTQEVLIGYALGANFNITTDQAISITTGYRVTKITVTNASVNMTTAAGGFYSAATKGGTALVAATQVYTALTSPAVTLDCTIAEVVGGLSTVYFSLTTPQGVAATGDIRIYGVSP